MQEARSWYERLALMLENPREKERLARELGVHELTLTRWAQRYSKPRTRNLHKLLKLINANQSFYAHQIYDEDRNHVFDQAFDSLAGHDGVISSEFYAQVLTNLASLPPSQEYFWPVATPILERAFQQLNSHGTGLALVLLRCVAPPAGGKVRSLVSVLSQNTEHWGKERLSQRVLLGAESLSGYVVSSGHACTIDDCDSELIRYPFRRIEGMGSVSVYPLKRLNCIAGCLWVASAQTHFITGRRSEMLQRYADLLTLACEPEAFYLPEQISLGIMPSVEVQKPYFATIWERHARILQEAEAQGEHLTNNQAMQRVMYQLEDHFLTLPSPLEESAALQRI